MPRQLKLLIDFSILASKGHSPEELGRSSQIAKQFLDFAESERYQLHIHPVTENEVYESKDSKFRSQMLTELKKFAKIEETEITAEVQEKISEHLENYNGSELRLLNTLYTDTTAHLVTNDRRLRDGADKLEFLSRVLTPDEAFGALQSWQAKSGTTQLSVEEISPDVLNLNDPIFEGLRKDYPKFDEWMNKVRHDKENRRCWTIQNKKGVYQGIALVKVSDIDPTDQTLESIKISTFKVADEASGRRLGELLLKNILRWAHKQQPKLGSVFIEVRDSIDHLPEFLSEFGFVKCGSKTADESFYLKKLIPPLKENISNLDHHKKYGPPAIKLDGPIYVIPIIPKWYDALFPDAQFFGSHSESTIPGFELNSTAHGNAIRKAYLSQASINEIEPGALLLFYRSQGDTPGNGAISAVGVAEDSIKQHDPIRTLSYSSKRTVYSFVDIEEMHADGKDVLSIRFRHDRFLDANWPLKELIQHCVLKDAPQAVMQVKNKEGLLWIAQQLNE